MGKYFHVHTSIFSAGEPLPHWCRGNWLEKLKLISCCSCCIGLLSIPCKYQGRNSGTPCSSRSGPCSVIVRFVPLVFVPSASSQHNPCWQHLSLVLWARPASISCLSKSKRPFLSPISDFSCFISSLHHVFLSIPPTPSWSSFAQLTS